LRPAKSAGTSLDAGYIFRRGRVARRKGLCFTGVRMQASGDIDKLIADWRNTGGSELANTLAGIGMARRLSDGRYAA